jgi:hypothetical protein
LGLASLLLPEALLRLCSEFNELTVQHFVSSSLGISITLVFNLVLLYLLIRLALETFRWATQMANIAVSEINRTRTINTASSILSTTNISGSNAPANGLLLSARSISHLFRSLAFASVLQQSKSLLNKAWSLGFWLSKVLVFVQVGAIGVKSIAWITTVRIHPNAFLYRKGLMVMLIDLSRSPSLSIMGEHALQLLQCAVL